MQKCKEEGCGRVAVSSGFCGKCWKKNLGQHIERPIERPEESEKPVPTSDEFWSTHYQRWITPLEIYGVPFGMVYPNKESSDSPPPEGIPYDWLLGIGMTESLVAKHLVYWWKGYTMWTVADLVSRYNITADQVKITLDLSLDYPLESYNCPNETLAELGGMKPIPKPVPLELRQKWERRRYGNSARRSR